MEMPITVTLSNKMSERVKKVAELQRQDILKVIEAALDDGLPWDDDDLVDLEVHEPDEEATSEMQAYIAMHPMLKEKYFGQYVAIFKGQLIDYDTDHAALFSRIDAQYPDEFVWISPVAEEAIPTLVFRSPRIEQHEPV